MSKTVAESITYKITDESRIQRLNEFLQNHDKSIPIALLYDDDADGMCSGTIMRHTLTQLGFTDIVCSPKSRERETFTSKFLEQLESIGVETLICVDFEPISWRLIGQDKMAKIPFNVAIIDHHFDETENYDAMTSKHERIFIHPLNSSDSNNSSQYCCAKFVYDVCMYLSDISAVSWKQLPGIIGDMNIIKWADYVRALSAEYGVIIGDDKESFFLTSFGEFATVYGFAASINADEGEEVFDAYFQAKSIDDMSEFRQKYADMEKEYNFIFQNWQKEAVYDADHNMYFVEIKSKYLLTSLLSSVISYVNDRFTFFFYQHNKERSYHISMRSQKAKVHLGELLKHVSKGFNAANGGGHIPAAGGYCHEKDFDAFKQKIRDSFDKFKIE